MKNNQNKNSAIEIINFINSLEIKEHQKMQLFQMITKIAREIEESTTKIILSKIRKELWTDSEDSDNYEISFNN